MSEIVSAFVDLSALCVGEKGIEKGRYGFTQVLHNALGMLNASLMPHTGNGGSIFIDPAESTM